MDEFNKSSMTDSGDGQYQVATDEHEMISQLIDKLANESTANMSTTTQSTVVASQESIAISQTTESITGNRQELAEEHQLITQYALQLAANLSSDKIASLSTSEVFSAPPITETDSKLTDVDDEHQLITRYTGQLLTVTTTHKLTQSSVTKSEFQQQVIPQSASDIVTDEHQLIAQCSDQLTTTSLIISSLHQQPSEADQTTTEFKEEVRSQDEHQLTSENIHQSEAVNHVPLVVASDVTNKNAAVDESTNDDCTDINELLTSLSDGNTDELMQQLQLTIDESATQAGTSTTDIFVRQEDAEHQLIVHYATSMSQTGQQETVSTNDINNQLLDTANEHKLLDLQTKNLELRRKIDEIKQNQKLQEDIKKLQESVAREQEKRLTMTQTRDEMMRIVKARNTMWRTPTISQAGSELSIDETLSTPTSIDEYFDIDDTELCSELSLQQQQQIHQLQQQLQQMVDESIAA